MRLYLSENEAFLVRLTLLYNVSQMAPKQQEMAQTIIDRIDLCQKLQKSENKSKK